MSEEAWVVLLLAVAVAFALYLFGVHRRAAKTRFGVALKSVAEGRSSHWPAVRKAWLKDHAVCEACTGTANLEVHHVVPFNANPSRELDQTNFMTLCETPAHNCHLTWGHFYDWKTYNPNVRRDVLAWRQSRECVLPNRPTN